MKNDLNNINKTKPRTARTARTAKVVENAELAEAEEVAKVAESEAEEVAKVAEFEAEEVARVVGAAAAKVAESEAEEVARVAEFEVEETAKVAGNGGVAGAAQAQDKSKQSHTHQRYLRGLKRNKIKILTLQIVILVSFFGLWELLTATKVLDAFIFSSPSRVFKMLGNMGGSIFHHIGITLLECVLGFVISTALGVFIAFLLWWSETARRVLEPYIVVLNSLPKIALGPIIIVWMGVGTKSIVVMAVLICIVVTIISSLAGFLSCDQGKILLLRSMGARKSLIFFKLILPHSVPDLLSVLKVNVGLAWVGTIMGEYLVSGAGLGYLIIYGGQIFKLDLVMTATLILCVLAALMYLGVALLEKKFSKHRD